MGDNNCCKELKGILKKQNEVFPLPVCGNSVSEVDGKGEGGGGKKRGRKEEEVRRKKGIRQSADFSCSHSKTPTSPAFPFS